MGIQAAARQGLPGWEKEIFGNASGSYNSFPPLIRANTLEAKGSANRRAVSAPALQPDWNHRHDESLRTWLIGQNPFLVCLSMGLVGQDLHSFCPPFPSLVIGTGILSSYQPPSISVSLLCFNDFHIRLISS